MATVEIKCPICGSTNAIEYGKSKSGKQRYAVKTASVLARYFSLRK